MHIQENRLSLKSLRVHIKNLIETRLLLKGKFSGVRDQVGKIEIAENKSGDERFDGTGYECDE